MSDEEAAPFLEHHEAPSVRPSRWRSRRAVASYGLVVLSASAVLMWLLLYRRSSLELVKHRDQPYLIKVPTFMNTSTVCDLDIRLVDDSDQADVWMADIFEESAGAINHSIKHSKPTALYTLEAAFHLDIFTKTLSYQSTKLRGFYDLLLSYRWESDLPLPYSTLEATEDYRTLPLPFSEKLQEPLYVLSPVRDVSDLGSRAAVMISHCGAVSGRDALVIELMRLLPGRIYSYGNCYNNRNMYEDIDAIDGEGWYAAKQRLLRKHKMYLVGFRLSKTLRVCIDKYYEGF